MSSPELERPSTLASRALVALIACYQYCLSPFIGRACRFHPSCSCYTREAIEKHGALAGSWLGVCRLCRCHPFRPGGLDPVPEQFSFLYKKQ